MDFDLNQTPIASQGNVSNTQTPPPNQYCLIDLNQCFPGENDGDNEEEEEEQLQPQNTKREANKKKHLAPYLKRAIIEKLILGSTNGKLQRGYITNTAHQFSVSFRSVSRLWHDAKLAIANGDVVNTSSKMVKRVGRKKIQLDLDTVKSIPLRRRTNIRSAAYSLNLSTSTVYRRIKDGNLRPHSNHLKPELTDDNKKARVKFCLKMIAEGMNESSNFFIDMYDRIHIDEKWFYITKTAQKYYLHAEEEEPLRTCKSKRFITKIMFLTAVARPRFDHTMCTFFDGKIGIWPFVIREAAKRSSKNRPAGTMETKAMTSVNKEIMRKCLIEKLLPAISEKWSFNSYKTVFIQQDNAKPHVYENDEEFMQAVRSYDLDIRLLCQPPNGPDLNVLDLGFFRAIAALQHQYAPTTVDEFIASVTRAFEEFSVESSDNIFLTLQSCMQEIMRIKGGNHYKIPHMNKAGLIRANQLPIVLQCDPHVLNEARAFSTPVDSC